MGKGSGGWDMTMKTTTRHGLNRHLVGLLAGLAIASQCAFSQQVMDDPTQEVEELSELSLETLMDIDVTSVSKKKEKLQDAPAAIDVLTHADLQKSGVRTLPEALRLVPGVEVQQLDRNRWAVSIRGFNGAFSDKLLVLLDGRTLYTPLFGGTFWNQQIVPIENIERIEVIRGPGATLWGANAVNGVINIITMNARDTQGGLVKTIYGTHDLETVLRYGLQVGEDAWLRVHGNWFHRDDFADASGNDYHDDWNAVQGGARLDWAISDVDSLTVLVDGYRGRAEQRSLRSSLVAPYLAAFDDRIRIAGANVLARWTRELDDDGSFTLQAYWDHTVRKEPVLSHRLDTFDIDFQHRLKLGEDNELIWGVGYRLLSDNTDGSPTISFEPAARNDQVFSAFVQDDLELVEDRLHLIVGSKFEHNDYSGFEVQPGLRLLWTPSARTTVWGAVSRSVKVPQRSDQDLTVLSGTTFIPGGPPVVTRISSTHRARTEEIVSYELGWRFRPEDNLSLQMSLFYNDYEHLSTNEVGAPFFDPGGALIAPVTFGNGAKGETYGFEVSVEWRPFPQWSLAASYSFLDIALHERGSTDPLAEDAEGASPHHRAQLRSNLDIADNLTFSTLIFWNDSIPARDIPSLLRVDLNLIWSPWEDFTLAAGVRNLLDDRHPEFEDILGRGRSEVERSFYISAEYRF